jgi:hypothetical protein
VSRGDERLELRLILSAGDEDEPKVDVGVLAAELLRESFEQRTVQLHRHEPGDRLL